MQVFAGHRDSVACGGFVAAGGGKRVATGSLDGSVRVWNPRTGEAVAVLDSRLPDWHVAGGVVALAHEPALQLTASACEDGTVQLWSARWEELGSVAPPRPDLTPTALAVLVRYRFPHGRCCAF